MLTSIRLLDHRLNRDRETVAKVRAALRAPIRLRVTTLREQLHQNGAVEVTRDAQSAWAEYQFPLGRLRTISLEGAEAGLWYYNQIEDR